MTTYAAPTKRLGRRFQPSVLVGRKAVVVDDRLQRVVFRALEHRVLRDPGVWIEYFSTGPGLTATRPKSVEHGWTILRCHGAYFADSSEPDHYLYLTETGKVLGYGSFDPLRGAARTNSQVINADELLCYALQKWSETGLAYQFFPERELARSR